MADCSDFWVKSQGFSIIYKIYTDIIYIQWEKNFTFPTMWTQLLPCNNIWYCVLPFFCSAFCRCVCCLLPVLCILTWTDFFFFLSFWVLIVSALSLKISSLVLPKHKMSSQVTGVKVYCLSTACSKFRLQKISYINNNFSIFMLGLRYWGCVSQMMMTLTLHTAGCLRTRNHVFGCFFIKNAVYSPKPRILEEE